MAKAALGGGVAQLPQWKEQVLIDLSRQTMIAFGIAGDEKAAFEWVAEDAQWFGPFAWQELEGIESIRKAFVADKGEPALSLSNERWHAKRVGSAWVVICSCTFVIDVPKPRETLHLKQRTTFVWGRQPEGPRIACVHCSHAVDGDGGVVPFAPDGDMFRVLHDRFGEERDGDGKLGFRDVEGHVRYLEGGEILCVLAEGPRCRVKTIWGKDGDFSVREGLQKIGERLPGSFVRSHRSCVVNVDHIARIERGSLLLDDGSVCPLAARRHQAVRSRAEALAR